MNISDVVVSNPAARYASTLSGISGHNIEDVRLSNITVLHPGGGTHDDAAIAPPEKENGYPEPTMFGTLPAYGFYVRHAARVEVNHVDLRFEKENLRPAFVLGGRASSGLCPHQGSARRGASAFALKNASDFNVYISHPLAETLLGSVTGKTL